MIPLTVIIPFYNAGEYLKRTTESLLNQTLDGIEYLFVDDGSTDNSRDVILLVLSSYPHKKDFVRIVYSSDSGLNSGIAKARQTGLDLARGRYVTFCDSDDWVDADYYEELYDAGASIDAQIVTGDHCTESVNGLDIKIAPDIRNWVELQNCDKWFHLSLCNRLIKRSFIKDNNIYFFEGINFSEDYGFLMRAYYYGENCSNVHSKSLYHYNKMNDGSLTTKISEKSIRQRIECLKRLDYFFKAKGENTQNCFVHNFEKFYAKESLLTIGDFSGWRKTFPEVVGMILKDSSRSVLYKYIYLLSQQYSYRLLKCYCSLGQIMRKK